MTSDGQSAKPAEPAHTKTKALAKPKPQTKTKVPKAYVEDEDNDYVLPKRPRPEPTSWTQVLDSDGEEILSDTEQGAALVI